ncbi:GNAT family N-acetyltransferase [Haliangium sp.]|uniref:GNAT family N-acetyltransferase n=1 Tax=Haliangium sp. TaxID=2663208 RepID=UPI003D139687
MAPRKPPRARPWTQADIDGIVACHQASYSDYPAATHYDRRLFELQLEAFPQGQCLVEMDGRVVGYATSLIVQLDDVHYRYTYSELTGAATFSTHEPSGDTLYGADIAVHPEYRRRGVARRLYEYRVKLMRRYNLRRMLAYGRIPGYAAVAGQMTPEEYVQQVLRGERRDQALSTHMRAGYQVKGVALDLFTDRSSLHYSTVLEMPNRDFKPERRRLAATPLARPVRNIRVCAAQWQLRSYSSWDQLEQAVSFFVDAADAYHCHVLLFPELFAAGLLGGMPREWDTLREMRALAEHTERYLAMFRHMAEDNGLYIIGGSQPVEREGKLYNVAHLFSPTGKVYTQDKLHITPGERQHWGIQPGTGIKVFDTPLGRFAIQVCYDIEFPEIARLLTLAGVEVFFVPFSTDERKAYQRVRFTAQARAVENIVYVVIAGNVGNLPTKTYLLNYGQAAVFTPSDFGFPLQATLAEAEVNLETVVISDLDIGALVRARENGSVRPLYDRRPDLYQLAPRVPIDIIRVE